jgi:DNA-binding NarL/FixJ family response regulator
MSEQTTDSASVPSRPRVVLVDDHGMFRAGVRAEIGAAVDIVGEAATVEEAVSTINRTTPEVVLLDVHLPAGGGPAVVAATLRSSPNTRFLALSVSDAAEDVISVIRAGARGYVTKTISGPDLIDAIRRVADGDVVFSPRLAGFVLDAFRDGAGPGPTSAANPELDQLTPREQEVLRLLARGYSYREIGSELFISIKTVETHASNVLRKLQLSSRHQLTRWAAERRIV